MKTKTKTMIKRTISVLLATIMIFGSAPIGALLGLDFSGLFEINASAATYSGTCGTNLTWTLDTSTGELVIRGTGAMTSWSSSSYIPWYSYRSNIKTVIIENGVTSIGSSAFEKCSNLTSVTIPDSVTSIGEYAFYNCTGLTSVTIPDSVTSIGYSAFDGCAGLSSVTIPDSVTSIGSYAFYNCTGLTSVTIPDSVTRIGSYAFAYCDSLTDVYYTGDIAGWCSVSFGSLYANPMYYADNLYIDGKLLSGDIVIPEGVTRIGSYAFAYCDSLESVTIPDSVTSIGEVAFNSTAYYKNESNWENGVLYIGKHLIEAKTSISGEYAIKDGTLIIADDAFQYCDSLTSVTIPDSVTSIGTSAFYNCTSLTDVYYTAGWCEISFGSSYANPMYYADNLYIDGKLLSGDIVIPDSVTSIGNYAFYNCDSLESVVIPDSVTSIGNYAFEECSNLTSVTIGNSVTSIGSYAFYSCDSLTNVVIGNSVTSIGSSAFRECTGLTSVTIPDSVTSIGYYAFEECSNLTSVTIGNSVTSIGSDAFYYCKKLSDVYYTGDIAGWCEISFGSSYANPMYYADNLYIDGKLLSGDIVIPDSVTSIGSYAFYNCDSLESVVIPDSVTSIGDDAFSGCTSLTSVTIPDSVTSIGSYAFYKCTSLESVTIPDSVTSIGDRAFYDCYRLTSVTIPDSVTSIGYDAFSGCYRLTSVTIPDSVTSIGDDAFYGCSSLKTVYYTGTPEQWGKISIGSYNSPLTGAMRIYECNTDRPYYLPGSCGDKLTYVLYTDGELVISGTGTMTSWSSSSSVPWDNYRSYIKTVTIGDLVTSIGNYAFEYCSNLESVTIGNSVTSIGDRAFYDCDSLTSVTIPDSVKSIGSYAFYGCDSLTSVTIGNSVTSIGYYAFAYCDSLTDVYYTGDIAGWCSVSFGSSYANPMFYADNLYIDGKLLSGDVVIPEGVTSVGYSTFRNCVGITSITIPDSVTSIGNYAFYGCSSLKRVYYTGTPEQWGKISIGSDNYPLTEATRIYECNSDRPYYLSGSCGAYLEFILYVDGELVISGQRDMTNWSGSSYVPWYKYRSYIKTVTIGNLVTSIGSFAFYDCDNITSITIPESVTSIGKEAFSNCDNLTEIIVVNDNEYFTSDESGALLNKDRTKLVLYYGKQSAYSIPDSVTSIDSDAFYDCDNITSITIPESVTNIAKGAFSNCDNLAEIIVDNDNNYFSADESGTLLNKNKTKLVLYYGKQSAYSIPDSVTSIGDYAFYDRDSLESVTIPDSVTSIGNYAFYNCDSLKRVYYAGTPSQWNKISIGSYNSPLTGAMRIYECNTDRPYYLSGSCGDKLTYVLYTDGELVISGTGTMKNWSSSSSVPWYLYSSYIKTVTIGDLVTSIGNYAFYNCTSLTSATIGNSVTSIGSYAFYGRAGLSSVTIPDSVKSIGSYAFYGCTGLSSVTIPDSVTSIGSYAFYNCTGLTSVTIGYGIKSIGDYAFKGCNKLVDIYYTGTDLQWVQVSIGSTNDILVSDAVKFIHVHKYTENITKQPTCTEKGSANYSCKTCEYSYTDEIPATGHSHESKVTKAPTCTETGIKTFTCHCGDSYTEEIPANGHTEGEWETVSKPTIDADGKNVKKCTVCNEVLKEEVIEKLASSKDEKTGVELGFDKDDYDGEVEISVQEEISGTAFNIVTMQTGAVKSQVFDITMTLDGEESQPNGKVVVRIPLPADFDPKASFVCYIDAENNKIEMIESKYENGYFVFETDHFSYYSLVELGEAKLTITAPSKADYKTEATFSLNAENLPENAKITWSASGAKVKLTPSADGKSCKVEFIEKGDVTITVTTTNFKGETVSESAKVTVKYTWWQWILVILLFGWIWY